MNFFLKLLISFSLFFYSINATAQTWNWANSLGSIAGNDEALDVATDNQGNTYVTGIFSNVIETSVDTIVSSGNIDIFVAKFDTIGNLVWLRRGGGTTDIDRGEAIDVDANGNVYVTGYFRTAATFDNITVTTGLNSNAIFTAKYNTNGTIQWVRIGTNGNANGFFTGDRPHDIKVDDSGNVYITGQKSQPTTFGSITVPDPQQFSIGSFLVKYDTNGNEQFGIPINPSTTIYQPAKIQIQNNSLFVLYINYSNSYALEVRKYNTNGILQSTYPSLTSGGTFQQSDELNFAVASDESLYLYAEFQSTVQIGGNLLSTGSGFNFKDLFLSGYSSTGAFQWVKQIGGGGSDREGGIAIDTADNLYISGFFDNAMTIDTTVL
ncbi:MAG: hypothetical protein ACPG3Z_02540, partial [Saprospiraceae bacterium]